MEPQAHSEYYQPQGVPPPVYHSPLRQPTSGDAPSVPTWGTVPGVPYQYTQARHSGTPQDPQPQDRRPPRHVRFETDSGFYGHPQSDTSQYRSVPSQPSGNPIRQYSGNTRDINPTFAHARAHPMSTPFAHEPPARQPVSGVPAHAQYVAYQQHHAPPEFIPGSEQVRQAHGGPKLYAHPSGHASAYGETLYYEHGAPIHDYPRTSGNAPNAAYGSQQGYSHRYNSDTGFHPGQADYSHQPRQQPAQQQVPSEFARTSDTPYARQPYMSATPMSGPSQANQIPPRPQAPSHIPPSPAATVPSPSPNQAAPHHPVNQRAPEVQPPQGRPSGPLPGAAVHNPSGDGPQTKPNEPQPFVSSEGANAAGGKLAPPDGIVPIDLGPGTSYQQALALWYALSEADQLALIAMYRQSRPQPSENAAKPTSPAPGGMDVDQLFTMGSASAHTKPSGRKPQRRSSRKTTASTAGKKGAVPSGTAQRPDFEGPSRKRVKTAYVEDATDESEAEAYGAKFAQAGDTESYSMPVSGGGAQSGSRPGASPNVNPIPGDTHIGVVMLDAVHQLNERMARMEDALNARGGSKKRKRGKDARTEDFTDAMEEVSGEDSGEEGDIDDAESEDDSDDERDAAEAALADKVAKMKAAARPHMTRLAAHIRYHLKRKLLKYKSIESLPEKFKTLTKEEVKEFEKLEDDSLTPDTFRVDFVRGWKTFSLNVEAREFFIAHFFETMKGGAYTDPPIPEQYLTEKAVGDLLDAHMKYLRSEFKKNAKPKTDKDLAKEKKQKLRKRNAARQHTTLKVRKRVIRLHDLGRHKVLFARLKPSHMSGDDPDFDESDQERQKHPRTYFIVEAWWQSQSLKDFLRLLDEWHLWDWRQSIGDRLPGGNPPRRRVCLADPRVVNSAAPKGLWRNCYNKDWLDNLKPHKRRELDIIDEDYDFSMPEWSKIPQDVLQKEKEERKAKKSAKKAKGKGKARVPADDGDMETSSALTLSSGSSGSSGSQSVA